MTTQEDALTNLSRIALTRALGSRAGWDRPSSQVGSDRLIQAGLDALLAGVDSPSLPLLAGLLRSEEPEAPELFDQVLEELGLTISLPDDPRAAQWFLARRVAERVADGSLDPAAGTFFIWEHAARDLGYPKEMADLVACADNLECWEEHWGVSLEELQADAVEAARQFLTTPLPEEAEPRTPDAATDEPPRRGLSHALRRGLRRGSRPRR